MKNNGWNEKDDRELKDLRMEVRKERKKEGSGWVSECAKEGLRQDGKEVREEEAKRESNKIRRNGENMEGWMAWYYNAFSSQVVKVFV